MKFVNVEITVDPMTTIPAVVPEYEIRILQAMYQDVAIGEPVYKETREDVNAGSEYLRLHNKYGMKEAGSPVEQAYGLENVGTFAKAFAAADEAVTEDVPTLTNEVTGGFMDVG